jgi:exopolysaccharide biosynthesis polyprenyl glycosylphosphotransferase
MPVLHSLESEANPSAASGSLRRAACMGIALCEPLLDGIAAICSIHLAWAVARIAHAGIPPYIRPNWTATAAIALYVIVLLERAGAYRPAKSMLFVRETAILMAVCCCYIATLAAAAHIGMSFCPMLEVPLNGCMMFLVLLLEKTVVHNMQQKLHERGITAVRVALCGASHACGRLFSTLVNSPKLGMWPLMVADPFNDGTGGEIVENGYQLTKSARILHGELSCDRLQSLGVEKILVVASSFSEEQLKEVLKATSRCSVPTEICAGDLASSSVPVEWADIDGIMIWRPMQGDSLGIYAAVKRGVDFVGAAFLLILLAPVMLCVACAIKATSPGPILFRQERVGKQGKLFTMLKFRTMHQDSCGSHFSPKSGHDPRISKIGRVLRKTSLDELPQLFNVLAGEMSLVGPRPEMPFIVKGYTPIQQRRLEVLPGITGLWQLSAHRKDLIHNNMQYDLYYVRHRNCFLDMAILVHTLLFAMRGI